LFCVPDRGTHSSISSSVGDGKKYYILKSIDFSNELKLEIKIRGDHITGVNIVQSIKS
jgi:hypothetical protein